MIMADNNDIIRLISSSILATTLLGCINIVTKRESQEVGNDSAKKTQETPEPVASDPDFTALRLSCEKLESSADNLVSIGCNILEQSGAKFALPDGFDSELSVTDHLFSESTEIRVKQQDDTQPWHWMVELRTSALFNNLITLKILKSGELVQVLQAVSKVDSNLKLNDIKYSSLGVKKDYRFGSSPEDCFLEQENQEVLAGGMIIIPFFFVDPDPEQKGAIAIAGICTGSRDGSNGLDIKIAKAGQIRVSSYVPNYYTVAAIGSFPIEAGVYNLIINVPKGNLIFKSIQLRTNADFFPVFGAPVFNLSDTPKDPGITPVLGYLTEEPLDNVLLFPEGSP